MKNRFFSLVVALLAVGFLVACGDSGSSNSKTSPKLKVSGVVYDPAIVGADVSLVCKKKTYYANQKTNAKGEFSITGIDSSTKLNSCILESIDGKDGGNDFKNTILKAPLAMFSQKDKVVITPITSMVAFRNEKTKDLNKALEQTSNFLKISKQDLNKKPTKENLRLSKKITMISLAKDKDTNLPLGFNSLDPNSNDDLTTQVEAISTISEQAKDELLQNLRLLDTIEPTEQAMLAFSTQSAVEQLLFQAYDINKSDSSYTAYKQNIDSFSLKITQALKKDDGSYVFPNRYVLRKAMSDANLTISREDNGSLKDDVYKAITKKENDFNVTLATKQLDIKDIKGVTLYDVKTYKKILGDDNDKRVEYYTFSNISNIGEALEIAKTSYDDNVLDPIYKKIANGYIKLGFYDEAVDIADENIYSDGVKIQTLTGLATQLIEQNKNELGKKALDLAYNSFKIYAKSVGKENLSDDDYSTLIDILVGYNDLSLEKEKEAIVAYMNEAVKGAKPQVFSTISYAIKGLIEKAILAQNKKYVKYLVNLGYEFAIKVPLEQQNGNFDYVYRALMRIVPYTTYVDETQKGNKLIERGKKAYKSDPNEFEKKYEGEILAHQILGDKTKMQNVVSNFDSYAGSAGSFSEYTKRATILENGLATALVLDNNTSGAVELITQNYRAHYKTPKDYRPEVFKFFVNSERIETANILGFIDKDKQEEFILALFNDSKTNLNTDENVTTKDAWTFIRSGSKYRDKNKDMVVALFEGYDGALGYPTMIEYLAKNKSYDKIKGIIDFAMNSVIDKNISTAVYKTQATVSILRVLEKVKYFSHVNEDALRQTLNDNVVTLASKISFDSTAKSYDLDVDWSILIANYLSSNNQSEEAKKILEKIRTSLKEPDPTDFSKVKAYIKRQIGSLNTLNEMDTADERLLGGYISAKESDKAKTLIDSVKALLDKEQALDKDEMLLLVARAYAMINKKQEALSTIDEIQTIKTKNEARLFVTKYLASYDSFPDSDIASIDTDQDGKPDFFSKFATQEQITASGLTLDDDIDGDGIKDDKDNFPYCKDKN